jgi:hypothetical protein
MNGLARWLSVFALVGSPALAAAVPDAPVLQGTVTSAILSAPIQGARVVLRGRGGFEQVSITDERGAYSFKATDAAGRFSLDVFAQGFKPFVEDDLSLTPDSARTLDVHLDLADVQESVVVRGTGEVLSIRSNAPDLSQTVTASELAELPSSQRSVVKYALVNPHVRQVLATNTDGQQSQRLSINAKSYRHTAYMLDGVINYDWVFANGPYQMVAASAVEDVQVVTNHYPAEFGTTTSGVVRVNTQSGSRNLKGELFTFVTPSGIQAKPALSPFRVPNQRIQWGGLLGGPLVTDKTYFFLNYEGIDQRRGAFIQSPSPGFHVGDGEEHYVLGRIDHHLTDTHSLAFRFNFYRYENDNPNDEISDITQPSAGRLDRSGSRGAQFTDRLVFGRFVNFVRVNYAWYYPNNNVPIDSQVRIERPRYSIEGNSGSNYSRGHLVNISDALAFHRGRHQFKMGAEVVRIDFKDNLFNEFGTYRFAAGPPRPGQNPLTYVHVFGASDDRLRDTTFQAYASDDLRLSSRLSASLGLRYEYQTLTTSLNRFLPRLGMAWDATADGRTKVTAGVGAFSETFPLIFHRRHLRGSPTSPVATYTIPFGVEGFPTFPNSLTEPPDPRFQAARRDLRMNRDDLRNPYSWQASAGVEREIGNRWSVVANAIYNRTTGEFRELDINAPTPFDRTRPGQRRTAAQADPLRPHRTFLGVPVRRVLITGNSDLPTTFAGLDIGIRRKYGKGIRMEAHYLLSHSVTYTSLDSGTPDEWDDLEDAERGPSDTHQKHRFVATTSVDLPYGLRFAQITTLASGLAVNPLTGTDNNGDTHSVDRPVGFRRNSFRAPTQANTDVNLAKVITLGGGRRAEIRLDVFNLFNKNNFINVDDVYGEGPDPLPTFLEPIAGIQNAEPSRRVQIGVRLMLGR